MWPKLRADIEIKDTGFEADGTPTWVIYDPLRRLYYRLGWVEYEILVRWDLEDITLIVQAINHETTLTVNASIVEKLIKYLSDNNLLDATTEEDINKLVNKGAFKNNIFKTVLQRYIAFYIPIFRPEKFLNITFPIIKKIFFHKTFIYFIIFLLIISIYLIGRQWDEFINSYDYFFNSENLGYLFFGIFIVKLIHELGHAYAAKYYNCHIASMGIAFLVIWPLLYTDTTDTWKLKNRNHRVVIQAAGMISEMCFAVIATFLWTVSEEGIFRSIMFYISTISWFSTILVNCNPLIRFDGYHVFADLIKVDNLQQRGFLLGSWKLKQILLGVKEEQPVQCPEITKKYLLIYSYLTWVYRFFLFIGIAILIYHLFFKALGIILMFLEIFYLLIMPIFRELRVYFMSIKEGGRMTNRAKISISVLILLILILVIPWKSSISMPAILEFSNIENIYTPYSSQIKKLYVKENDKVKKGDVLIKLYSPELDNRLKELDQEIAKIKNRLSSETSRSTSLSFQQASEADLKEKMKEIDSLMQEINKLKISSKIDGTITYIKDDIKEGNWLQKEDLIIGIAEPNKWIVISYIKEGKVKRIKKGDTGKFYPYSDNLSPLNTEVVKIYQDNEELLSSLYLASIYQGEVAVIVNKDGSLKLEDAVYKVVSKVKNGIHKDNLNNIREREVRGEIQIKGNRESLLFMVLKPAINIIVRESGF